LDGQDSIPNKGKIFLYSTRSRLALGPTQPPLQWVPWLFLREKSSWSVKLTTHLHLVSISKMMELYLHSLISLHGVELYLYLVREFPGHLTEEEITVSGNKRACHTARAIMSELPLLLGQQLI
jgi:hypothetical protein